MNEAEKAIVKKLGDDFISNLPALIAGEVARLPAAAQPYVAPLATLLLPAVLPSIQAWFDAQVA
jgi:hypothetical protein